MKNYEQEIEELKKIFCCPECGKKFKEVNGLYVSCSCGYIEDSTFQQIMSEKTMNYAKELKAEIEKELNNLEQEKLLEKEDKCFICANIYKCQNQIKELNKIIGRKKCHNKKL